MVRFSREVYMLCRGGALRLRLGLLVIGLGLLPGAHARAQATRVAHGVFFDEPLHFSYPVPEGLVPFDLGAVAQGLGQPRSNQNEALLFAAKVKDGAFGVVLLAERMGADRKPALLKPDDFLDALQRTSGYGSNVKRSHLKTASGVDVAVMEWQTSAEFDSGVVFQTGQHLVCLKFNAPTAPALARMMSTVGAIQVTP